MTQPIPTLNYLSAIPSEVPAGKVIVHNTVKPPTDSEVATAAEYGEGPLGIRGFRAWTQAPSDKLERCDCRWAPEAGPHYRVAGLW